MSQGKGDTRRPLAVDREFFKAEYDRIFAKKPKGFAETDMKQEPADAERLTK